MIDLDKEFKKLNYGLGSYPCGYVADYQINANETITFRLKDGSPEPMLIHTFLKDISIEDINAFKMECLKLCSHAKKKRS